MNLKICIMCVLFSIRNKICFSQHLSNSFTLWQNAILQLKVFLVFIIRNHFFASVIIFRLLVFPLSLFVLPCLLILFVIPFVYFFFQLLVLFILVGLFVLLIFVFVFFIFFIFNDLSPLLVLLFFFG